MERFLGNINAKADAKGRLFVPAVFRKNLQASGIEKLVLRKNIFLDCLVLYPKTIWDEEVSELRSKLNRWDEEQEMIFHQYVMDIEELEMDSNGRVLIPKRYLQLAGITSDVRFVGVNYTVEIWARNKLNEPMMSPEAFKKGIQKWMAT
ncbi:MAG: cell division/cell wall cluster transcriptional repressor MraZ [Dysgonamonadaceae bacterium]|jgi:MraZ protein|nr:cell division/cell wall cluster transcriptional repressor MraZ [Dysgonamonadaceae bacterium]